MKRKKKASPRVALEINKMYGRMAEAAARKAVEHAGQGALRVEEADKCAEAATRWATRAGGNAIRWGLT